jgi:hypothetical protein
MTLQALLVRDVQQSILDRLAGDADYLPRLRKAIDAANGAGIPVYVVVGLRAGFPEISTRASRHSPSG